MFSNNWRVKQDPPQSPNGEERVSPWSSSRNRGGGQTGGRDGGDRPNQGQGRFSRNEAGDSPRKSSQLTESDKAIEEGRRIYVGNLSYDTTAEDIETIFQDAPRESRTVHMSVDPMTKRNPGYCFVTFTTKDMADEALNRYDGQEFKNRTLRVKPGVRSDRSARPQASSSETPLHTNDRWKSSETSQPRQVDTSSQDGKRLYVGGLPRIDDQETANRKIREIFEGFDVEVVSKLISPHPSKVEEGGNHYYCFVDLANNTQVNDAVKMFDGNEWGLKVSRASGGVSGKVVEKQRIYVGGLPDFGDESATEAEIRELFSEYNVKWVSKLCSPREPREGNSHFCFVELQDSQEADGAIVNLDWSEKWGGKIRVKPSLSSAQSKGETPTRGWRGKSDRE
ncbi:hypothetical protein SS1G_07874 [Sclerotinia sclerotiorum 1980 UF-70]|uniref:RRM domain-containing protein n=2 Tax=Sclerotinia sclerotiorum (strain ATCC 18683 / 1980 / Ss-1) TaxID=665079 RepID=A7ERC0_SCLS1|nr:hypothetical protein SS1G_07874 [Sclerotinia sclerotiorum 1980 UF-70]APA13497.1 hypothetical protein sscle_11g082670 [Sclerotinia sclerotiorum 1980 UF-70]EDN92012.1 hypothetical protein SS1G_07874 [Sclerotinia sclerotiorum 1980 UF-70]